eukprot:1157434-Pelagomonas_calceolata.AAC.3
MAEVLDGLHRGVHKDKHMPIAWMMLTLCIDILCNLHKMQVFGAVEVDRDGECKMCQRRGSTVGMSLSLLLVLLGGKVSCFDLMSGLKPKGQACVDDEVDAVGNPVIHFPSVCADLVQVKGTGGVWSSFWAHVCCALT